MNSNRSRVHRAIQLLRMLSQSVFFFLFLWLLLETRFSGEDYIGPRDVFFHFDPLLGLTTLIASRTFLKVSALALVSVILTALFGRLLCGWICPLGATLQFFSFAFKKAKWHIPRPGEKNRMLLLKYGLLIFVLASSVFTLDLAGILDPLSLLYRSFTVAVMPSFAAIGDGAAAFAMKAGMTSTGDRIEAVVQGLSINRMFHQMLLVGSVFLGVILLNLHRERFWCRYLCPAGAMLGLLARRNLLKVKIDSNKCVHCGICTLHCQTEASPHPNAEWKPEECIYCYSCASSCPAGAIRTAIALPSVKPAAVSFERRKWVLAATLGVAVVPLFRSSALGKRAPGKRIRPPGAAPESQFLTACVRCGACMKVCPTNALQPATTQGGAEGLWTPVVVPQIGFCEYYCSLCTQVCPTDAIQELTIREKIAVRIGSAWINRNRCIPFTIGESCSVCEEQCPTSPKAVELVRTEIMMPDGSWVPQRVPVVNLDHCIGCGICENKCPVADEPGIYCTSLGESRSANESRRQAPF